MFICSCILDAEYKEENVEVMIWMSVKGKYEDTEHVKFKTLPAIKVASCILKGSYQGMNEATASVVSWIKDKIQMILSLKYVFQSNKILYT